MLLRPSIGHLQPTFYPNNAWVVNFSDGWVRDYPKDNGVNVRCVRGGQSGGFGNLAVTPASRTFPNRAIESCSAFQQFTVSNTGGGNLRLLVSLSRIQAITYLRQEDI